MKVLYPGSFDPFTIGHLDIVKRCLDIFDNIVIGIGYNEKKQCTWSVETRLKAIDSIFKNNPRVEVKQYCGLTVDFAKKEGIKAMVRGVRNATDYEYEKNIADVNKEISGIDTILLFAKPELSIVSGTMLRELMHNGYDIRKYLGADFPLPSK